MTFLRILCSLFCLLSYLVSFLNTCHSPYPTLDTRPPPILMLLPTKPMHFYTAYPKVQAHTGDLAFVFDSHDASGLQYGHICVFPFSHSCRLKVIEMMSDILGSNHFPKAGKLVPRFVLTVFFIMLTLLTLVLHKELILYLML